MRVEDGCGRVGLFWPERIYLVRDPCSVSKRGPGRYVLDRINALGYFRPFRTLQDSPTSVGAKVAEPIPVGRCTPMAKPQILRDSV